MSNPKKTKSQRIIELERQLKEAQAYQIHTHYFASTELDKFGIDKMMGSGVILELSTLGGRTVLTPVMISDGLSPETIAAIKADLVRSYNKMVEFKPKGA